MVGGIILTYDRTALCPTDQQLPGLPVRVGLPGSDLMWGETIFDQQYQYRTIPLD